MKAGDIAVFDKAYVAYGHLHTLNGRGIFRVTRAKDNARFEVKGEIKQGSRRNIISDEVIELSGKASRSRYPGPLRRIRAKVTATDGTEKEMTFLTNNFEWAASTICELYRCRWSIEVFFKEIKQTLQLRTFIGFSRNAIEWQLWSALIAYLLLRLHAWLCSWKRDFRHFFTLVKGVLWCRRPLEEIVSLYGTAGKRKRVDLSPTIPYLMGLDWNLVE